MDNNLFVLFFAEKNAITLSNNPGPEDIKTFNQFNQPRNGIKKITEDVIANIPQISPKICIVYKLKEIV